MGESEAATWPGGTASSAGYAVWKLAQAIDRRRRYLRGSEDLLCVAAAAAAAAAVAAVAAAKTASDTVVRTGDHQVSPPPCVNAIMSTRTPDRSWMLFSSSCLGADGEIPSVRAGLANAE
jgi:hypothetical protein